MPPGPRGYQVPVTARIKKTVGALPVVAVGRITTPELAEEIVATGKADFVGMARQLIADSHWLAKAAAGKPETILPCVGTGWCLSTVTQTRLGCAHNPAVGYERTLGAGTLTPAETPRDVAVVGGGLAGLRAAYVAASRNHRVTLFERSEELGGQIRLLNGTSYDEYQGMVDWLIERCTEAGVKVELGTELGTDLTWTDGFDHVVLSTGSDYLKTGISAVDPYRWGGDEIEGVDQFNVFTVDEALRARRQDIPHRVMIFDDTGTRDPMIVAEQLARANHPVEFVTRLNQVGPDLAGTRDQGPFYSRLRKLGVTFRTRLVIDKIDGDEVTLRDLDTGDTELCEGVDAVVLCTGKAARTGLQRAFEAAGRSDFSVVGDALAPRRFFNAVWEAENAARAI
jgi:NADPH-dependent 2,4-dienoyl-CoA reductase/sulfur reductase-like enzyme